VITFEGLRKATQFSKKRKKAGGNLLLNDMTHDDCPFQRFHVLMDIYLFIYIPKMVLYVTMYDMRLTNHFLLLLII
jgi:hypothetical protein